MWDICAGGPEAVVESALLMGMLSPEMLSLPPDGCAAPALQVACGNGGSFGSLLKPAAVPSKVVSVDPLPRSMESAKKRQKVEFRPDTETYDFDMFIIALLKAMGLRRVPGKPTLRLATACSGSGIVSFVLQALLGNEFVELFASEQLAVAALFLMCHVCPKHIFMNSKNTVVPGQRAPCYLHHGSACKVPKDPQDVCVIGFSCKPYCKRHPRRWIEDPIKAPGESNDVDTYYDCHRHLVNHRPDVWVLENLDDLDLERAPGLGTVLDFILHDNVWGLKRIQGYTVEIVRTTGLLAAIPQQRKRILFFGSKTHIGDAQELVNLFEKAQSMCGKPFHAKSFLQSDPGSAAHDDQNVNQSKTLWWDAEYAKHFAAIFDRCVKAKHLSTDCVLSPKVDRPSQSCPKGQLTAWQAANLDLCAEIVKHREAATTTCAIGDISQCASRAPLYYDGVAPTLTTNCDLFLFEPKPGRWVSQETLFAMMGFPVNRLNLTFLRGPAGKTLVGNGICAPTMACAMIACLTRLGYYQ